MTPEMTDWVDVSVTVRHACRMGLTSPVVLERVMDPGRGEETATSPAWPWGCSGTHMDGPAHLLRQAAGLDEMPLTAAMGEARAILWPIGRHRRGQPVSAETAQ